MATKYEIKKFIEHLKSEAHDKSKQVYQEKVGDIKRKFLKEYFSEISSIKLELGAASDFLDTLCERAKATGVTFKSDHWGNPMRLIQDADDSMSDDKLTCYFSIPEIQKAKQLYEKQSEEINREYNKLTAITQNMGAKDGIALLKSLGIDTTDLEAEKPVTALTISIDRDKLFL
jgi:hypothetical protein